MGNATRSAGGCVAVLQPTRQRAAITVCSPPAPSPRTLGSGGIRKRNHPIVSLALFCELSAPAGHRAPDVRADAQHIAWVRRHPGPPKLRRAEQQLDRCLGLEQTTCVSPEQPLIRSGESSGAGTCKSSGGKGRGNQPLRPRLRQVSHSPFPCHCQRRFAQDCDTVSGGLGEPHTGTRQPVSFTRRHPYNDKWMRVVRPSQGSHLYESS
jgi:hypothetical protein